MHRIFLVDFLSENFTALDFKEKKSLRSNNQCLLSECKPLPSYFVIQERGQTLDWEPGVLSGRLGTYSYLHINLAIDHGLLSSFLGTWLPHPKMKKLAQIFCRAASSTKKWMNQSDLLIHLERNDIFYVYVKDTELMQPFPSHWIIFFLIFLKKSFTFSLISKSHIFILDDFFLKMIPVISSRLFSLVSFSSPLYIFSHSAQAWFELFFYSRQFSSGIFINK